MKTPQTPPSTPTPTPPERRASAAIMVLAVLWLTAVLLFALVVWPMPSWRYSQAEKTALVVLASLAGAGLMFLSRHTAKRSTWARHAGIVLGVLSLLAFPVGTLFGAYLLFYLTLRWRSEHEIHSTQPQPNPNRTQPTPKARR